MITDAAIRRGLEASLAETEPTMASIAAQTERVLHRDQLQRKAIRFAKDAVLFAEQGKVADFGRALEKAAIAYLEWRDAQ